MVCRGESPARRIVSQNTYAMLTTKMVAAARNRIWVASIRANMGTSPVPHPQDTSDCNNGRTVSANRIIVRFSGGMVIRQRRSTMSPLLRYSLQSSIGLPIYRRSRTTSTPGDGKVAMHVVSATTGRDCSISQATVAEVKALALFVEPDAIAFDQKFALVRSYRPQDVRLLKNTVRTCNIRCGKAL